MSQNAESNKKFNAHRRGSDNIFTLLCIDDETVNLKVLASIFKESYKVVVSKSAKQGLAKALEILPDLILLDVLMPDKNGFEFIVELKQNAELAHIPVIFITGLQSVEDEEKGLTLGACDYIQKPFNYGIVRARVHTHFEIIRQRNLLEKFANFDSLTELPNRRKWEHDSTELWNLSLINPLSLTFGIIDIDYFKKYNDLYGHQQGDIALRKVSQTIQRVLFIYGGAVYRCGGEEFYFYIPNHISVNSQAITDECVSSIANLNILHEDSAVDNHLTISLGAVQVLPNEKIKPENVMKLADEKLYQVKNSTRNAVSFIKYSDYIEAPFNNDII
jgi:diguanylate cyclase (GGDEF)-like protein